MKDGFYPALMASKHFNKILKLRNLFLKGNVFFPVYRYAMELLGYPGNYHFYYENPISKELREEIYNCMKV